jgi:soluble lytic murein transglycosylase-like protein
MTAWFTAVAVGTWAAAHQPAVLIGRRSSSAPTGSTGGGGGCAYDSQIRAAFGSAGDWAVGIARRESGCDPGAYNRSGASGLFQLLGHQDLVNAVCPGGSVFDPACNIAAAKKLYDGSGTAPWRL